MSDSLSQTPQPIDVDPSFRLRLVLHADQISYLPLAERSPLYVDGLFVNPKLEMIAPEKVWQLVERDGKDEAEATLDKVASISCEPLDFFMHGLVPEPTPRGINLWALPNGITQTTIYDIQRLISARTKLKPGKPRGKLAIGCFDNMSDAENARKRILEFYEDKIEPRKMPLVTLRPLERE